MNIMSGMQGQICSLPLYLQAKSLMVNVESYLASWYAYGIIFRAVMGVFQHKSPNLVTSL